MTDLIFVLLFTTHALHWAWPQQSYIAWPVLFVMQSLCISRALVIGVKYGYLGHSVRHKPPLV